MPRSNASGSWSRNSARGSVPSTSRAILARCFHSTIAASAINSGTMSKSPRIAAVTGVLIAAAIPASEEMRVTASNPSHTIANTSPIGQPSPSAIPISVATPLPPRKRSHSG
jgi:hypothetical protein